MSVWHFNTSHVTVYLYSRVVFSQYSIFQYISCYCLSRQSKPSISLATNFNTSHVTVYRISKETNAQTIRFQYISCYCLSVTTQHPESFLKISIHLMLLFIFNCCLNSSSMYLFQYISCYCLSSRNRRHIFYNKISIHLMLLFIVCFIIKL